MKAGYRLRSGTTTSVPPTMHHLGVLITEALPMHATVVLEGLFVPAVKPGSKRFVNPQSIIPLAEATGLLLGPLLPNAGMVLRPLASEWRRAVGIPVRCDAKAAEEYAVMLAKRMFHWEDGFPAGLTYAEEGACAEAACMVQWCIASRRTL